MTGKATRNPHLAGGNSGRNKKLATFFPGSSPPCGRGASIPSCAKISSLFFLFALAFMLKI
jgi:hypothetical protein